MILVGAFMAILDSSIVNIAIPTLMHQFNATTDQVTWVITIYMLALGVVVPASGWLGDRLGYKNLYILSLIVFTAGSALCGLSWSLGSLIFFRMLQAIGGGMIMPTTMSMLYRMVPRERIGTAMGIFGIAVMGAPAIGPTLGGYLVEFVSWRAIFYVNVPIGIIGAIWAMAALRTFPTPKSERFDLAGFLLSAGGLFALLYAFSEGQTLGWTSEPILLLFYVAVVLLAAFVVWELRHPHPLLNLRVFAFGTFTLTSFLTIITTVGLFGGVFFLPLFLQNARGLGALQTGLVLLPAALTTAVMMPISGRLYDRIGPRYIAMTGLILLTVVTYMFHTMTVSTPDSTIIWLMVVRGVGMGLAMMPVMTAGMAVIPTPLVGQASAISNIIQRVASSFGIAILASYFTQGQTSYTAQYSAGVGPLTPTSLRLFQSMTQALTAKLHSALAAKDFVLTYVHGQASLQGFVRSFQDIFVVMAIVTVLAVVLSIWLPNKAGARSTRGPVVGD